MPGDRLSNLSMCSPYNSSTMRIVYLFVGCAWTACAAPILADRTSDSSVGAPSLNARSNEDGESRGGVIAAGVVFSIVVVTAIIGFAIMYLRDPQNFFKRHQEKKRISELDRNSTVPLAEDFLKRSSVLSERESIMFSRSRSSSMQFAVVESQHPQPMQKVFYRQGDTYVPLDQVDTSYNPGAYNAMNDELHFDPHVVSPGSASASSSSAAIPVVITPPPATPSSSRRSVVSPINEKALPPNPPVEMDVSDHHLTRIATTGHTAANITSFVSHAEDESFRLLRSSR
jgi:hypothetical protein